MDETLVQRIEKRMKELNLSAQAASLKVSKNRDMFRTIIRAGDNANPTRGTLALIAQALNTSENWLINGSDEPEGHSTSSAAHAITRTSMPLDIPVRGTAAGSELGKGAFQISLDVVDYVARPPGLANARDIYALYVEGDSMEPMYKSGDLVFVNPNKPIRVGDTVIIQEQNSNNGEPQSFIKIFKKRSGTGISAQQLNPFADIEFIAQNVKVHKVMTTNELFGV